MMTLPLPFLKLVRRYRWELTTFHRRFLFFFFDMFVDYFMVKNECYRVCDC